MRLVGMGFVIESVRRCVGILLLGTLSFAASSPYRRQAIVRQTFGCSVA